MKKSLTIAIPLFNEEEGIQNLYKELDKEIQNIQKYVDLKILLVNDGSTDKTQSLLEKFFLDDIFEIITHNKNLNLDGFLKTSIGKCSTDYIAFLDSDCTYPPKLITEMLKILNDDIDIINASPWHPKGSVVGLSKFRELISKFANLIYRTLLNKKVYTSSSILKLYRIEKIRNIDLKSKGFVSITELFCKALLNESNFIEFPCQLNVRMYGSSKIQYTTTIFNHLSFMKQLLFLRIKSNYKSTI